MPRQMQRALPSDATLASIWRRLSKPEEYVRRSLGNLIEAAKKGEGSRLTIGITGSGQHPNYKIDDQEDLEIEGGLRIDLQKTIVAYSGSNHEKIFDPKRIQSENWSKSSMNIEELKALIGTIRGIRGR